MKPVCSTLRAKQACASPEMSKEMVTAHRAFKKNAVLPQTMAATLDRCDTAADPILATTLTTRDVKPVPAVRCAKPSHQSGRHDAYPAHGESFAERTKTRWGPNGGVRSGAYQLNPTSCYHRKTGARPHLDEKNIILIVHRGCTTPCLQLRRKRGPSGPKRALWARSFSKRGEVGPGPAFRQ